MNLIERLLEKFVKRPQAATLQEPEWWRQTLGMAPTTSGAYVTPQTAMTVTAVYACVRIISESIATLPLHIYQRKGGSREKLTDHTLARLLGGAPNELQTAIEMRELLAANLCLWGNAYCAVIRDGTGWPVALYPLQSRYMTIDVSQPWNPRWIYNDPAMHQVFTRAQLWRITGLSSDGVTGLSPIAVAREAIGVTMATDKYAGETFGGGATPPGVLEFPAKIQQAQVDSLRAQFADAATKRRPLILESGMAYKSIGMSAEDAQFIESRRFQIAEVARIFRVPLHMLAEMQQATFSNIEHQSIEFVVHTLRPWLTRFEQSIQRDLIPGRSPIFAVHSVEGLLRGDTKARYEAYSQGIQDGWLSRNEVRAYENLNPVPGLDEYVLPVNISTLKERDDNRKAAAAAIEASEQQAVDIEANRRTPEKFVAWAEKYYNRLAWRISDELDVPAAAARHYTDARLASIRDDPVAAVIALSTEKGHLWDSIQ